jgi:hypothetical protein
MQILCLLEATCTQPFTNMNWSLLLLTCMHKSNAINGSSSKGKIRCCWLSSIDHNKNMFVSFIDLVLSSRTMCIGSTNYRHGSIQKSSLLWEVLNIGLVDFDYLIDGWHVSQIPCWYPTNKEGVLFCFFKLRSPKPQHPCHILVTIGKPLMSRGMHWGGFIMIKNMAAGVIEYWAIC